MSHDDYYDELFRIRKRVRSMAAVQNDIDAKEQLLIQLTQQIGWPNGMVNERDRMIAELRARLSELGESGYE